MQEDLKLNYTNATSFPEDIIYDLSYNGVVIETETTEGPIPWDAGFSIKEGKLIIEGHAGPSGYGSVRVEVPIKDSPYQLYVEPMDEEGTIKLKELFNKCGIILS